MARQLIQTAYRVSILTFISCLGPIPYFSAIIYFLFVTDRSSCFCGALFLPDSFESLHLTFSCPSITFRKHCSQYASAVPVFLPLTVSPFSKTEQGIQKYSWHLKQVYFVFFKQQEQDCSSLPAIFLNLVFCAW